MTREGSLYRRCRCGAVVTGKRCPKGHPEANLRWCFKIDVGSAGGTRRTESGTFRKKSDAMAALLAIQQGLANGSLMVKSKMTTEELVIRFFKAKEPILAKGTQFNYANCWRRLRPYLGAIRLQALSPADISSAYSNLLRTLSYSTVFSHHVMMQSALSWAVNTNLILKNPAAGTFKERRQPKTEVWTNADWACFVAGSASDTYLPLWTIYHVAGLRRGEALALRWRDVDFDDGRLVVARQVRQVPNVTGRRRPIEVEIAPPKSERGNRSLLIDEETIALLRSLRSRQQSERAMLGLTWTQDDLVFARSDGRALLPSYITNVFRKRVQRLGLPKLSIHGLRRSLGAQAMRTRMHPKVLTQILGHAAESFTMAMYQPFTPGVSDEAMRSLLKSMRVSPAPAPSEPTVDRAITTQQPDAPSSQSVHADAAD